MNEWEQNVGFMNERSSPHVEKIEINMTPYPVLLLRFSQEKRQMCVHTLLLTSLQVIVNICDINRTETLRTRVPLLHPFHSHN